ncbi:glycosyltransferase family 8 protein [Parvibaculum sp.]|uniref:glycosyltransferase family 8 protein n=1 Tax=Parvibaculum sp. TaxID=2024848 RepID=UPI00320D0264
MQNNVEKEAVAARHAVVLCTDRNMFIPALFVADAVRAHAKAVTPFDIVIVTDDAAATEADRQWMAAKGIRHEIIDFEPLRDITINPGRLTTATLVKLLLPEIFSQRYERILYLDTDLTIHADVTPLFGLDLGGHAIAAQRRGVVFTTAKEQAIGETHFAELGMSRPYCYCNTGVICIDVAAWNSAGLTARTLDYVRRNPKLCLLPDEDSLNAVLDGQFAALSPVWNMLPRRRPYLPLHDLIEPAIVHYAGSDKPWKRFGKEKPLFPDPQAYRLYQAFLATSPWPRWLGAQWTMSDLKNAISSAIRTTRRRLKGKYSGPSNAEMKDFIERFARYCAEAEFADVAQGLVLREGSRLRPNRDGPRQGS